MGSALVTLGGSGRLVAPIVEDILKIMGGTHLLMIACSKSRNPPKKRTPPPHVIRQLLRPDDIARLFDYVRQLHFGAVIAVADEDEGWLRYSESHEVRYLHHDNYLRYEDAFSREQEELFNEMYTSESDVG